MSPMKHLSLKSLAFSTLILSLFLWVTDLQATTSHSPKECAQRCTGELCAALDVAHDCFKRCPDFGEPCMKHYIEHTLAIPNKLNTSNPGKIAEFKRLFGKYKHDISNTTIDLDEIDSDPLSVIAQKASAVNGTQGGILVEDTSLDVEGEDVGVNIRWLLDHLENYAEKPATWTVLLAFREDNLVFVAQGQVKGRLVTSRGSEGFGFDPYFMPDGADKTLAQDKPDDVNARALAVKALLNKEFIGIVPVIEHWDGKWQHNED